MLFLRLDWTPKIGRFTEFFRTLRHNSADATALGLRPPHQRCFQRFSMLRGTGTTTWVLVKDRQVAIREDSTDSEGRASPAIDLPWVSQRNQGSTGLHGLAEQGFWREQSPGKPKEKLLGKTWTYYENYMQEKKPLHFVSCGKPKNKTSPKSTFLPVV